jgi:hypothetical protein
MDPALVETLKQPIWQYYISVALVAFPLFRIFKRAGLQPFFALSVFVPWAGVLIAAYLLAFRAWPNVVPRPKREKKDKKMEGRA